MNNNQTIALCATSFVVGHVVTAIRDEIRYKRNIRKAKSLIEVQGMQVNALVGFIQDIANAEDPIAAADKFMMNKEFIDLIERSI